MGKNIVNQSKEGDGVLTIYVILIFKQLTLLFWMCCNITMASSTCKCWIIIYFEDPLWRIKDFKKIFYSPSHKKYYFLKKFLKMLTFFENNMISVEIAKLPSKMWLIMAIKARPYPIVSRPYNQFWCLIFQVGFRVLKPYFLKTFSKLGQIDQFAGYVFRFSNSTCDGYW